MSRAGISDDIGIADEAQVVFGGLSKALVGLPRGGWGALPALTTRLLQILRIARLGFGLGSSPPVDDDDAFAIRLLQGALSPRRIFRHNWNP